MEKKTLGLEEIKKLLPHRYPFLMVDKVLDFEPNKYCHAIKNVTIGEPYFEGHFPDYPLFPGVYQVEAVAQVAGLALMQALKKEGVSVLAKVKEARFREPVLAGDCLLIKVEVIALKANLANIKGKIEIIRQPEEKRKLASDMELTLIRVAKWR